MNNKILKKLRLLLSGAILIGYVLGVMALGFYVSYEQIMPASDNAWEECDAIDDKTGNEAYYKCLDDYQIGPNSKHNKNWYIGLRLFVFWAILIIIGGLICYPILIIVDNVRGENI